VAQNFAARYTKDIDERFHLRSVTDLIVNKGMRLDFNGVNSVTIYNVDVPSETNYVRSGTNRFGSLVELGTGKQTFVLSQDKSFTFTIDRGNLEDSMMVQEAGKALRRTLDEVCIPNTDAYRLSVLSAYATANSQSATAALSSSNIYTKFLEAQALLDNRLVPLEGRVAFVTPTTANLLKQDTNFIKASNMAQDMLIKGVIGEVDGVKIVKVPTSYLVANTGFLIVHEKTMVAPHKFDTYRTLSEVQGIDGWVVEGRRYFDAFIPTYKGRAIQQHLIA
jgi:N4-gp56 family major capsid protein